MKKVGLWVVMFFIGVISIPLTWMVTNHVPFHHAVNAFFNTSNASLAFYFFQWILLIVVTELMIFSYEQKNNQVIQYAMIILLGAFVATKFYLYYLILVLILGVCYLIVSKQRNQLKDDLTTIIEDVKEDYKDQ